MERRVLRLYTQPSAHSPLEWDWVTGQLEAAGTYWVVARTDGYPHPRPVWGVWLADELHLSIGTPANTRALAADPRVTVHLDSGTDVVIVEGVVEGVIAPARDTDASPVEAYNRKYDWDYQVARYGQLRRLRPRRVIAWRTQGPAGRESFQATGSWAFK